LLPECDSAGGRHRYGDLLSRGGITDTSTSVADAHAIDSSNPDTNANPDANAKPDTNANANANTKYDAARPGNQPLHSYARGNRR
jgi:hypothetical protein